MKKHRNIHKKWNLKMFRKEIKNGYDAFPIFVHIPKTGGTYLNSCFVKLQNIRVQSVLHCPIKFVNIYKERRNELKFFSFAVVRNPYERFYSACKFGGYKDAKDIEDISNNLRSSIGINWISDYSLFHFEHFLSQKHFVTDFDGKMVVSYIGRYENLEKVISDLKDNEIDISDVFKVKPNKSSDWKNILTKKTIENLNIIYKDDFEQFNYTMI